MPALHNIPAIRALLEADRAWAAYPLGDLAPGFIEHCSWFQPPGGSGALALLYRAVRPPVLFTQGDPEPLAAILDEFCTESAVCGEWLCLQRSAWPRRPAM